MGQAARPSGVYAGILSDIRRGCRERCRGAVDAEQGPAGANCSEDESDQQYVSFVTR